MENKKQLLIKIVCILVIAGVICFFFLFFRKNDVKTGSSLNPHEDKTEEKPVKPNPNKYTEFPKYSSLYKKDSRINNIGGRGEENYIDSFLLNDEVYIIVETSSDNYDFNASTKSIAIAKLNKNLDLTATKVLEKTEGKKCIASTIFCDGVLLVVCDNTNTTVLLYNGLFELVNSLTFECVDYATLYQDVNYVKMVTYVNSTISFRIIDEDLNITAFVKTNSTCDGIYDNIISYRNSDIFITFRQDYFDVYKVYKKIENNNLYYIIERICSVKGIFSQLLFNQSDMTRLNISYLNNNKACITDIDTKTGEAKIIELNIASDGNYVIPLDNGYILHNYIDNSISILDKDFGIILSNLRNDIQNSNVLYSFYLPVTKEYYFVADSTISDNTLLYRFDAAYSSKVVLEMPKISEKINMKIMEKTKYLFIVTNNNIDEFDTCLGGNDIFAIKLLEEM